MTEYKTVTDYDIQALVDHELDWEEEKNVVNFILTHDDAKRRYDELKAQKKILKMWWHEEHQEN